MKVETTSLEDRVKVIAEGEVDLYSSPLFRKAILDAVAAAQTEVQVLLSAVTYMDSSGVATLVEGLRAANQKGTGFKLVDPSQPVMKVLQLARLDSIFTITLETD